MDLGDSMAIQLKGEETPRSLVWRGDFRQLADLDLAVGGLDRFDLTLLHHLAALLWVCSGGGLSLSEFLDRLPSSPDSISEMRKGASKLWQTIM